MIKNMFLLVSKTKILKIQKKKNIKITQLKKKVNNTERKKKIYISFVTTMTAGDINIIVKTLRI